MKKKWPLTILAVTLLLTACARPAASPTPTEVPPAPTTTSGPTAELVPTATSEPTAEPLSTATTEPTAEPVGIELIPFVNENHGIRSVAPESWREVDSEIAVLGRGVWPQDLARLYTAAYPSMNTEWMITTIVLPALGMDKLPQGVGKLETGSFTWELYYVEAPIPELGTLFVDLAFAEGEASSYMVAVTASQDDYAVLHDAVFLPAVRSLEPIAYEHRDRLTAKDLMTSEYQGDGPVNNAYFMPMGEITSATHNLEGTLVVPEFEMYDSIPDDAEGPLGQRYFPGFSVEFFTYEQILVPAVREIVPSLAGNISWGIILSPGRVWSEAGDNGLSRASLPFALVAQNDNEAHNGIATFLYDETQVSSFRFQVVQETAPGRRADYWGQSPMDYLASSLENREALASQFAAELSMQTPIRPWSDLGEDCDPQLLAAFNDSINALDISAAGLVMDGAIYLQPCYTRYGAFPYCRYMRHGSFSVSKSMGALVAMLRLAQKYTEEVFDLKIADYVEVTADHDGWEAVTFADALNMATGIGDDVPERVDPNQVLVDEDDPKFATFIEARSAEEKLDIAFSYADYPWGPGEVARYNSINTFLLSVAMQNFLRSKDGLNADIWAMVVEEVFKPIGIHHAPIMRTLEPDGSRGIPIFGWGMYPTVDDVAKVAILLRNGGQHQGQQLLHAGKLAEALRQTDVVGLPTGEFNDYGEGTYLMSVWSMPYRSADGHLFQVPYMSGFGGNRVIFNPNCITTFVFSDAHIYLFESMVEVAEGIEPFPAP
jgi:hypothetical protein